VSDENKNNEQEPTERKKDCLAPAVGMLLLIAYLTTKLVVWVMT
jgi:hypothetical protein